MKLTSLIGKGTGKLGGSVFAISEGRQIVREYQPKVGNPRTEKQQEQRARFSGLVLLAREFAPSLMYLGRKAGVSERNEFVRRNTGDDTIVINLANTPNFTLPNYNTLRLTSGTSPVSVEVARVESNVMTLDGACSLDFDVVKIDVYEFVDPAAGERTRLVLNGTNALKVTNGVFTGTVNVRATTGANLLVVAVAMKSNENSEYLAGVIDDGFLAKTSFNVDMAKKEIAAAISEVSAAGFAAYVVE